jgi:hypothetical protein
MDGTREIAWRIATLAAAVGVAGACCLFLLRRGWKPLSLTTHLAVLFFGVVAGGMTGGLLGHVIGDRGGYRGVWEGVAAAFLVLQAAFLGGFPGGVAALMLVRLDRGRPVRSWPSLGMALVSYLVWSQLAFWLGLFDVLESSGGFRARLAPAALLVALLLVACLMLAGEALADPAGAEPAASRRRLASPPPRERPWAHTVTAVATAAERSSRLRGFPLFAVWLLAGIPAFAGVARRPTATSSLGWTVSILAQGWVLQRALGLPMFVPWSVATLVGGGMVVPRVVAMLLDLATPYQVGAGATHRTGVALSNVVLVSVVVGTGVGLAQWAVLRRALLHARVWVPVVALAFVCSSLLALVTTEPSPWVLEGPPSALLELIFAGVPLRLLYPIITGIALVLLQGRRLDAGRPVRPLRSF